MGAEPSQIFREQCANGAEPLPTPAMEGNCSGYITSAALFPPITSIYQRLNNEQCSVVNIKIFIRNIIF
jgi:hypothetical protein